MLLLLLLLLSLGLCLILRLGVLLLLHLTLTLLGLLLVVRVKLLGEHSVLVVNTRAWMLAVSWILRDVRLVLGLVHWIGETMLVRLRLLLRELLLVLLLLWLLLLLLLLLLLSRCCLLSYMLSRYRLEPRLRGSDLSISIHRAGTVL